MPNYKKYMTSDNSSTGSVSTAAFRPSFSISSGSYRAPRTTESVKTLLNKYATIPKNTKNEEAYTEQTKLSKVVANQKQKDDTTSTKSQYKISQDKSHLKGKLNVPTSSTTNNKNSGEKERKDDGPPITYNRLTRNDAQTSGTRTNRLSPSQPYDRTLSAPIVGNRDKSPYLLEVPRGFSNNNGKNNSNTLSHSREPSPACRMSYLEKSRSRDPSPETKRYSGYNESYFEKNRSKDPSPVNYNYQGYEKNRSRDPSPDLRRSSGYLYQSYDVSNASRANDSRELKLNESTSHQVKPKTIDNYRYSMIKSRSREPSPIEKRNIYLEEAREIKIARAKANEASKAAVQEFLLERKAPGASYMRRKSREPSPCAKLSSRTCMTVENAKTNTRSKSPVRHGSLTMSEVSSAKSAIVKNNELHPTQYTINSRSLSTASDAEKTLRESDYQYAKTNAEIQQISKQIEALCKRNEIADTEEEVKRRAKIMVKVDIIHRGTSPTHPSSGSKPQRTNIAKTSVKTHVRALDCPKMIDKEIQSDRMDDTVRNRCLSSTAYSPTPYKGNNSTRSTNVDSSSSNYRTSEISSISNGIRTNEKSMSPDNYRNKTISPAKKQTYKVIESIVNKDFRAPSEPLNVFLPLNDCPRSASEARQTSQIPVKSNCNTNIPKPKNKDFRKSILNMSSLEESRKKMAQFDNQSSGTDSDSSLGSTKNVQPQESFQVSSSVEESIDTKQENSSSFLVRTFPSVKYNFKADVSYEEDTNDWLYEAAKKSDETTLLEIEENKDTVLESVTNGNSEGINYDDADQTIDKLATESSNTSSEETGIDFWATLNKQKEKTPDKTTCPVFKYFSIEESSKNSSEEIHSNQQVQLLKGAPGHLNIVYGQVNGTQNKVDNDIIHNTNNLLGSLVLGDRIGPEGLESLKPHQEQQEPFRKEVFISRHHSIDDFLGGGCHTITEALLGFEEFDNVFPNTRQLKLDKLLDDATIQIYKDGDYGNYLDLESTLAEQLDDIEELRNSRRNSLVIRTQLSVRVHSIIDTLLKIQGRELRRALFTLKQIFQEDKDLVHGFVALGGLDCLVKIGKHADQNHQNYVLRALGQVMLYVDGMTGVMKHKESVEWLYTIISSKYRLVVKTALKLLLVFVEYCESNCYSLINTIRHVDSGNGMVPWGNIMRLLKDNENADTELLIYATTLINKTLSGLNDQDAFYDETDFLEHQGMENIVQRYISRPGTDLDLLDQLQLYELALKLEDGEIDNFRIPDNTIRTTQRQRSNTGEGRRKSYRHSADGYTLPCPTIRAESYTENKDAVLSYCLDINHAENSMNGARETTIVNDISQQPELDQNHVDGDKLVLEQLKRDQNVKDLTQKLSSMPLNPSQEEKTPPFLGDEMIGLISKAKEELSKSKSRSDLQSPTNDSSNNFQRPKKSESDIQWEELINTLDRELKLCDLDFTDLTTEDDDKDPVSKTDSRFPPPPPPLSGIPMLPKLPMAPPPMAVNKIKKNKKTVKLFWKEVREDIPTHGVTIWDELPSTNVDTDKLEFLFESRAKDLLAKEKQQDINKNKEIVVLDHKRSNAINIAITKLPPSRAIKAAIMKMDSTVVNREGIEKLLGLLPTEEEKGKIQEAQMLNPDIPLGSAEQFLLTLSTIPELSSRLKLWAFKLDFENIEKEIAEPLMDLKQGVSILRVNETFKCILANLRSIGIFLNGNSVKGFQVDYLAKVPEVKDTVQKHSLLHHLCHFVMESSPNTSDLYSEIGPITRASKADFSELAHNIVYLEVECKASWDRLRLISKHDVSAQLKQKLFEFLTDSAERIIMLNIVHRRVLNRFRKFLLWLGVSPLRLSDTKPNDFCRIISEFALEYRTTRERVQQQIEKKASHHERNKTRGKLIIDIDNVRTSTSEDKADAELRHLLSMNNKVNINKADANFTCRRRKADSVALSKGSMSGLVDGDDELLETLVKTATKTSTSRTTPRERKRTRNSDRKSLRRTLKNGLNDEEKQMVCNYLPQV